MTITEFKDGYVLTYKEQEFKFKGRKDDVIELISKKVKELLTNERNRQVEQFLNGDF